MPLFSIVIPIYNVKLYLEKCVNSCLSQTFFDYEIILVDDGSTDGSGEICDYYSSLNNCIKVIHKENGGLVSARKRGVSIATGDYIVCLDGDDWLDSSFLEKIKENIDRYSSDMVCCGFYYAYDRKSKKMPFNACSGYFSKSNIKNVIFPHLLQDDNASYFPPSLWAKAIKRELYVESQYKVDNSIKIGEDCACVIPLITRINSISFIADCLYFYRQSSNSMTGKRKVFGFEGPKLLYEHFKKNLYADDYSFDDQIDRKIVHELFLVVVSQFYRKEKYNKICKDISYELSCDLYSKVLLSARFKKSFLAKLMLWSLRKKKFFIIKFYSLIR